MSVDDSVRDIKTHAARRRKRKFVVVRLCVCHGSAGNLRIDRNRVRIRKIAVILRLTVGCSRKVQRKRIGLIFAAV